MADKDDLKLDADFMKELECLDDDKSRPGGKPVPQRDYRAAALTGFCTCAPDEECPLGRKANDARCHADELRITLLKLKKAQVYLREP